jgi:hypothetical protein
MYYFYCRINGTLVEIESNSTEFREINVGETINVEVVETCILDNTYYYINN